MRDREGVSEDLRGWAWDRFPVKPRGFFGLGISEVAYRYCDTFRSVWLRRRLGVRGVVYKGSPVWWGRVVHEIIDYAARDVREIVLRGYPIHRAYEELSANAWRRAREVGAPDRKVVDFYRSMVLIFLSQHLSMTTIHWGEGVGSIPFFTEYRIDGTPLGLSNQLRIDALTESNIIIEFKYGVNGNAIDHRVGLAGYALALESELELPVDFGLLIYISKIDWNPKIRVEPVFIDDYLRREFLENRDEAIDVLMRAQPPEYASNCNRNCPLWEYCRGPRKQQIEKTLEG